MNVNTYILGELATNCYILTEENKAIILDPSDNADFILEIIVREKLQVLAILLTHGHFDHVLAVGELQESLHIPVYLDEKDAFLTNRTKETADHFLEFQVPILPFVSKDISLVKKGIPPFSFSVIKTPGHTPGGVSLYFKKEKVLFSGDTLFKDAIGRYDLSYSSKSDLQKSLQKLYKLPPDTIVYPGHGEITTIGNENKMSK